MWNAVNNIRQNQIWLYFIYWCSHDVINLYFWNSIHTNLADFWSFQQEGRSHVLSSWRHVFLGNWRKRKAKGWLRKASPLVTSLLQRTKGKDTTLKTSFRKWLMCHISLRNKPWGHLIKQTYWIWSAGSHRVWAPGRFPTIASSLLNRPRPQNQPGFFPKKTFMAKLRLYK